MGQKTKYIIKKGVLNNSLDIASEINEFFSLSNDKSKITLLKDQILFNSDTKPTGVYYLNQGLIKLIKAQDSEKIETVLIPQGNYIAVSNLLRNKKHSETAIAVADSDVYFISKKDFLSLIKKYPQLSHRLLVKLCYQLENAEDKLSALSNYSDKERIAQSLILLEKSSKYRNVGNTFQINPGEISNLLGIDVNIIVYYLNEFLEDKIINFFNNQITILNKNKLKQLIDNK